MHPCAWYRAIPGTTRTVTMSAPAVAEGSDARSSAELVLAEVVLAEVVSVEVVPACLVLAALAGLVVVVDGVALWPPSAVVGLPESVDVSLGTVVSVGVRPVGVTGGVADGVVGVALSTAEAGLSDGGFGDGAGDVLRACVGRSAARDRSIRGWPALDGSTWADSAVGTPARGAAASG